MNNSYSLQDRKWITHTATRPICILDFSSRHTFCCSLNCTCIIECYDYQKGRRTYYLNV
jgi:hypothetical protein